MKKLKKIFRNPTSDILFMIGLAIACVILINISNLVSNMSVAEGNQYAYKAAYEIIAKDTLGQQAIVEYIDEYAEGNIYISHRVHIEGNIFGAQVLMNQNEEIKLSFKEGGYDVDGQYENAIIIGQSLEKYAMEENGKKFLKINNEIYSIIGILKNSNIEEKDVTLYVMWDTMSENLKGQWLESGFPEGILNYMSNTCEDIVFDDNILKLIDDGSLELNYLEISSTNGGYERETYEKINKVMLGIGLVFSVLTCFSISSLWLMDRRRELAVRYAYGYSDRNIFMLLFRDTIYLIVPAFIIAIVVQWLYTLYVGFGSILEGRFMTKIVVTFAGILVVVIINTLHLMSDVRKFKSVKLYEEK